jgi:hypothetical protein
VGVGGLFSLLCTGTGFHLIRQAPDMRHADQKR